MAVKLVCVVLLPSPARLEVTVEQEDGRRRRVAVQWMDKVGSIKPPANWWDLVQGEIRFQDAEEHARKIGRKLPGV